MHGRGDLDIRSLAHALCSAENRGDWAAWRELVAEDLVMDHPVLGTRIGAEANQAVMQPWRAAVAGYRRELFDVVGDGAECAFRWTLTGHLTASVADWRLPVGTPVDMAGATFMSAREGLLVRAVVLATRNSLLGVAA